jgi:hypothetical protein
MMAADDMALAILLPNHTHNRGNSIHHDKSEQAEEYWIMK